MRWGLLTFLVVACTMPALAQRERAQLWCEQGGQTVTVNGIVSSTKVQKSYPSCTVTVYDNATSNLTSICSDAACTTPLANPFTSTATGYITFFAHTEPAIVDVQQSGGGLVTPLTIRGLQLCDVTVCLGGGGGGGGGVAGTPPHIAKFTDTTTVGDSEGQANGTDPATWPLGLSLITNALYTVKVNNATTGTTVNLLVARDNLGSAISAQPTDTNNLIGIASVGAGLTSSVSIAYSGNFPCKFDNQTTFNDWVVLGSGSQCHDAGAVEPASVQNIGRVTSVNSGAGTLATVDLGLPDVTGAASAGNGVVGPCSTFPGPIAYYTAIQTISCDSLFTTDGAGNFGAKSGTFTGTSAGFVAFGQGAAPTLSVANAAYLYAPATVTTSFGTALPATPGTVGQALVVATTPDGTHLTTAWSSVGAGNVTSFSSGNLSPLFTTSVATATTTPALSFALSNAAAHTFFGNNTGSTAAPAFAAIGTGDLPTSTLKRVCMMIFGAENASSTLANADIAPQKEQCQVPYAATIYEVDVVADAGTPSVILGVRHCTASPCASNYTVTNILSSALTAITGGGPACSKPGATAGLDTFTTCSATLQNTSVAIGDWIETVSATAGGTAKRFSVAVHWTVN